MNHIRRSLSLFTLTLLCATAANAQDRLTPEAMLQKAAHDTKELETISFTLKALIEQPMPADIASSPEKSAAWNRQTSVIRNSHLEVDLDWATLREIVKDGVVTRTEFGSIKSPCARITIRKPDASMSGAILKRQEKAVAAFKALCDNESIPE